MNRRIRVLSLTTAVMFALLLLSGCSSKAIESAKQIESRIQEQQAKAKSFNNINEAFINAENAFDIVKELASEKYRGRKTGTKENEAALQYISHQFKNIGLRNPEGLENYMQYYYQPVTLLQGTPKLELLNKDGSILKGFEYPKNFVFRVLSDSTENIAIKAPMKVMESAADITKQSYKDREVLLFSIKAQGRASSMEFMRAMYDTNASAVVVEVDVSSENQRYSDLIITALNSRSWGAHYKPIITVDSAAYAELAQAAEEAKTINLQCSYIKEKSAKTANVVGYIPGSDDKLKDEYIIIGAHIDHIGDNLNGTYNPGALDNASGVAAMLEIAKVMAEGKAKPKKTMVFIAFNGEEHGLIGSEYYAAQPVFPIRKAVMINLDMVGSTVKIPLSIAEGREHAADLKLEFLELAKTLGIDAVESQVVSSDHFNFGERDVPAVMLTHMDDRSGYHSPNDTAEDVDKERLKEVIELVLHYIDKKAY